MADFDGAVVVKTIRDNETKIILVDGASGTSATKKLSIAGVGDAIAAGTNDFGIPALTEKAGNYALLKQGAEGLFVQLVDAAGDDLNINADGSLPITDNGGSLTVDAVDLDIRDLTHASDSVKVGDGTDFLAISATGEASTELTNAQGADGATAPTDTVQVGGKDGSGNLQTISTTTAGQVNVVVNNPVGQANVCEYDTTATAAVDTPINHDYIITNTKTFTGKNVLVGARGQVFVRIGTYSGTTFTPKYAYFQQPKENLQYDISALAFLGDGTNAIRIEITNKDGNSSDVYSNLSGVEV